MNAQVTCSFLYREQGLFSCRYIRYANKETSCIPDGRATTLCSRITRQIWSTVPHSADLNPPVSSVTPPEFLHGLEKILSAEVRPKFLSYVDFGIAQLPEEKIRNPHFSRSSNE